MTMHSPKWQRESHRREKARINGRGEGVRERERQRVRGSKGESMRKEERAAARIIDRGAARVGEHTRPVAGHRGKPGCWPTWG